MAIPHKDFEKTIKLISEQAQSWQREFGHILTKKKLIANTIIFPNNPKEEVETRRNVDSILEGALLVYLFAMWEDHMPDKWRDWLTDDEKERINAYTHVRNSAAHGYQGTRARQRRKEFESLMPFDGIKWDKKSDKIDISDASVAIGCARFMGDLCKQIVIRLHKNEKP